MTAVHEPHIDHIDRATDDTGHSYLAPDDPAPGTRTPEDRNDSQRE